MSVYFATCREIGRVKIGHAVNVRRRLSELRTYCPVPLELEATLDGGEAEEHELHERFANHRRQGEWFLLAPEIEELIAANRTAIPAKPFDATNPVARLLAKGEFSQCALAERLGVTQATISRWSTGKLPMSRRTEITLSVIEREITGASA
jgi:DNA-binding transcriptional regulator YiaG